MPGAPPGRMQLPKFSTGAIEAELNRGRSGRWTVGGGRR